MNKKIRAAVVFVLVGVGLWFAPDYVQMLPQYVGLVKLLGVALLCGGVVGIMIRSLNPPRRKSCSKRSCK